MPRLATSTGSFKLSWLGTIRPTSDNDEFDPALWTTYVSTTLGVEVPVLSSLPRRNNSPLSQCGCKKHAGLSRRPHQHLHSSLRCNESARLDGLCPWPPVSHGLSQFGHNTGSRPAQANGAATWRSAAIFETKGAAGAWSSSSASPITALAHQATCTRTVCCHIPRTWMRLCVLLHSAKSTAIGNNTMTIRIFLFSPPS